MLHRRTLQWLEDGRRLAALIVACMLLALSAAPRPAAAASPVQIVGAYSYSLDFAAQTARLHVDELRNSSSTYTTGTLRLELWATSVPWASATYGYRVATYQIGGPSNGTLGPNQHFAPIDATVPIAIVPPAATYYATLLVTEYSTKCTAADGFCSDTYGTFTTPLVIGGAQGAPPSCTVSVNPTALPSSGGSVAVSAICSNSPSNYVWTVNGALVSPTTAAWNYQAAANGAASARVDTLTVVAANASGASAPASQSVTVAAAAPAGGVNLNQHGITGSWFNPATSGQGIEVEVYPDFSGAGHGVLFAGWFTYDVSAAGGQRWYAMQGAVTSGSSSSDLTIATGYGGNFNAAPAVSAVVVGSAKLTLSDCNHGTLAYHFNDGRSGTIPLQRLISNVTCAALGDNGVPASNYLLSGNWFNAQTGGQGLMFDVNPAQQSLFAAWYTFAPNGQQVGGPASQRWYVLQATYAGGSAPIANIPIAVGTGGVFDNPAPTQTQQVGTASIAFTTCNSVHLAYTFYGGANKGLSGSVDLGRVGPTPNGCALGGTTGGLTIGAVSSSAPTALAPVTLKTTGLDVNSAYSVIVTFPSGASTTLPPIRAEADGSVVIPAPLFIDPATGKSAGVNAAVQIKQGSRASNSVSLAVKDLPPLSAYGAAPGQISHAFLNYLTISLGRSLNHLQAMQAIPANRTNTSAAQQQLLQQMVDTIEMRNNVDIIASGSQSRLSVGTSSNGVPIQFDANSVELLDRIIAMHLQAIGYFPNISYAESDDASPQLPSLKGANAVYNPNAASETIGHGAIRARGTTPQDFASLIKQLEQTGAAIGVINGEIGALTPNTGTNRTDDRVAAGLSGLASLTGLVAEGVGATAVVTGAAVVGSFVAGYTIGRDLQNIYESKEGLTWESGLKLTFDVTSEVAAVFGANKQAAGLIGDITQAFDDLAGSGASGLTVQGAGFVAALGSSTIGVIDLAGAAQHESAAASPPQQFGLADGTAYVSNSQGSLLSSLAGVQIDGEFSSVAGDDGSYSVELPIGVGSIDYANMSLNTYDPVTGDITGAPTYVDLRGLNPDTPVQLPAITGSCIDDDAGAPDGDDPDCD